MKHLEKKKKDQGMALMIVIIFLGLLTSLGIWLSMTAIMEIKTTTSLKNYEEAFNLAEGASQLSIRYLFRTTPPPPHWDPRLEGTLTEGLPSYLEEATFQGGKKKLKPKIVYKGYSSTPPSGWMLNWQGYSAFHTRKYVAEGVGELPSKRTKSTVDVILLKVSQ